MLNWDDPFSKTTATKSTPQVVTAEPQTLAESYARSEVLHGMSFDDTGYSLFSLRVKISNDVN